MNTLRTAFALLILALSGLALSQGGFTTQGFETRIEIHPNRDVVITEIIDITFVEPRRGLRRVVPVAYGDLSGRWRSVTLDQVKVRQVASARLPGWKKGEGDASDVTTARSGNNIEIRIGNPSRFLTGPVRYTIQYRVRNALTDFAGNGKSKPRTELFWNATPFNWATAIASAKSTIQFPIDPKTISPALKAWSGQRGSTKGLSISKLGAGGSTDRLAGKLISKGRQATATVETKGSLPKGHGLTVALAMPKGVVAWAGYSASIDRTPASYPSSETPQSSGSGPPDFNPMQWLKPKGNPAMGWLPLLAPLLLVPLVRFWLRTPYVGPVVTRFDPPEGIGPAEAGVVLDQGFDVRDFVAGTVSLAQKGAAQLRGLNLADHRELEIEIKEWRSVELSPVEGRIASALELYGPVVRPSQLYRSFGETFGFISNFATGWARGAGYYRGNTTGLGCLFKVVSLVLIVWLATIAFAHAPGIAILAAILSLIVTAIGLSFLPNLTERGAKARNEILGLREFISRAQKSELEHATERMPAQALFERLLPYAIAFGLVQHWVKSFRGIDLVAPDWYDPGSDMADGFVWATLLTHDFESSEQSWSQAAMPPPPAPSSWSSSDTGRAFGSGSSGFSDFGSSSGSDSGFSGGDVGGGSAGDGGGGGGGDSW
jgi:uncharacterized membrane protein YgcG